VLEELAMAFDGSCMMFDVEMRIGDRSGYAQFDAREFRVESGFLL